MISIIANTVEPCLCKHCRGATTSLYTLSVADEDGWAHTIDVCPACLTAVHAQAASMLGLEGLPATPVFVNEADKTVEVDVSWTETSNYSATIDVTVPADFGREDIIAYLEDDDRWFELLDDIESSYADTEHRQVLDFTMELDTPTLKGT